MQVLKMGFKVWTDSNSDHVAGAEGGSGPWWVHLEGVVAHAGAPRD